MRHRIRGRQLSRPTDHRVALFRNLTADILRHGKIKTTEAKAKEARIFTEKMITLGKRGDLHARRQAIAFLRDVAVVDKLFHELAPRFAARPGGYTRIIHIGNRFGDAAPIVEIGLVE